MRWIVVAVVGLASTAAAGELVAPTRVTATLEGHTAHYAVRIQRAVKAGIQNDFSIDLPSGGVIVSATAHVDGQAHTLALDERTHVMEAWNALAAETASGTPPWLIAIHKDGIAIAAPHAATLTLDLQVEATTCFTADRRYADLPVTWRRSTDSELRVQSKPELTCAKASQHAVWWPVTEGKLAADRIATSGQRLDLEKSHYAHAELALAEHLSEVPTDLWTVFVVDASRSISTDDIAGMQRTIESYARHAPNSQIQVVAYARKARALLPRWTNARLALPKLARELASLELLNGSNADAGLDVAGTWLKDQKGTRRVVLFDDDLVPDRVSSIAPKKLAAMLPAGTLVHVVGVRHGDRQQLVRDDGTAFAALAALTEGWSALLYSSNEGSQTLDAEELVRPIALESIELKATGWDRGVFGPEGSCVDGTIDQRMVEGSACEWWAGASYAAGNITIDGLLWNHRVHREVVLAQDDRAVARAIAGSGYADDDVQFAARAVTENWSLMATWGGTGKYAFDVGGGTGMWGCGCDGPYGTIGHGSGTGYGIRSSHDVQQQVGDAAAKCHAGPATIELELTMHEIVGVTVTSDPNDRDCLTEAVWDLRLFRNDPVGHERVVVRL